jgi:molecular chaperone IbpA
MIYVVKAQSFLRTPAISLLMEGEDWMVGCDEVFETMPDGSLIDFAGFRNYPASSITALAQGRHRLELDLDGFADQVPRVEIRDGFLIVTSTTTQYAEIQNQNYLQRGISARGFRRSFQLSQNERVTGTNLHQGILQIEIEQAVPSAMEPVSNWVRAG